MYPHLLNPWAKLLFCSLLLPSFLSAQIRSELNLDDEPSTAFDTLIRDIRVPEIDPRQYIVIYEWNASNENKFRSGIRDENRMRSVERYQRLYDHELNKMKELATQLKEELRHIDFAVEKNEMLYDSLFLSDADEESQMRRLNDQREDLLEEKREKEDKLNKVLKDIPKVEEAGANNRYTSEYLKWEHGHGKDGSKFRRYKPFDFFDSVGTDYAGTLENYEEYYNEIVWRNAGTPDWEPIWWLNQYPWPNLDYRNIDLIDQDYRDQHFALIPYQKYEVLDRKAVLRIVFDKTQLARNEHFKGSIGLDAFLYEGTSDGSQGGDPREIEINPYSVIGEERKSIGLLNRPAAELADNLIVLIKKSNELKIQAEQFYSTQDGFFSTSEDQAATYAFFEAKISETLELIDSVNKDVEPAIENEEEEEEGGNARVEGAESEEEILQIKRNIEELLRVSNSKTYLTVLDDDPDFNAIVDGYLHEIGGHQLTLDEVRNMLANLLLVVKESDDSKDILTNFRENLNHLQEFREDLRPVITYLDYFDAEVGNTRDAFLNLIGKDRIDFDYLIQRIKTEVNKIDTTLIGLNSQLLPSNIFDKSYDGWLNGLLNNGSGDKPSENATSNSPSDKSSGVESTSKQVLDMYRIINQQLTASLRQISILLGRIRDIQGSPLSFAIRTLSDKAGQPDGYDDLDGFEDYYDDENVVLMNQLDQLFKDNKSREKLRSYLAEKAGEILYQDLVFGTIDLDFADAGDGDLLFIRMYWDKEAIQVENAAITDGESNIASLAEDEVVTSSPQRDGVALYIAKFKLTERGWKARTNENFMLVNRVREDLLRSNYPLNSTRFKPTGGVSLTWGLRNDFRVNKRIRFDPITNLPRFDRNGRLKYNKISVFAQRTFKWLEPSFGVNFTYLDFTEEENFEVGVGPSVGLFNNTFFLSTGWNLMELQERPFYIGIGASILNLGSKVSDVTE